MDGYQMVIMSSCDENYFALAKGLFLSLIDSRLLDVGIQLAFHDIGCSDESIGWLRERGIKVVDNANQVMGKLNEPHLGYHRAQTCRPFLRELFPYADVLCWVDCDTWFQDASIVNLLFREAVENKNSILISPEIHYTYTKINDAVEETHAELHGYYEAVYGKDIADKSCKLPSVNSGFFVMSAECDIWSLWKEHISRIYCDEFTFHSDISKHFAEQISLNVIIQSGCFARYFDPAYNYLCLWNPPFRDDRGMVRMSYPPYTPVGMLHLAGGWKYFGRTYAERDLLYDSGNYLNPSEKLLLLRQFGVVRIG